MTYQAFCGGIFETNCYLLEAPQGVILFDAPDGACAWLEERKITPTFLLLTHGHFDHIPDVAKIKRRFDCKIGCHADTVPMISDPDFFRNYGFGLGAGVEIPVKKVGLAPEIGGRFLWGARGRSARTLYIALGIHFYSFPGDSASIPK